MNKYHCIIFNVCKKVMNVWTTHPFFKCYIRYKCVSHGKAVHKIDSLKVQVIIENSCTHLRSNIFLHHSVFFLFHFYQITFENPIAVFWFH